jgi:heterotetrameric sarcosine oxidase gamma subunit
MEAACVSDQQLVARTGLEGVAVPGRHGTLTGEAGVSLSLRTQYVLAHILVRRGQGGALAARVRELFGFEPPRDPRRAAAGNTAFVWAGPGHWLATTIGADGHAFEARLRGELGGFASVTDQSHGRIVVGVAGPRARDTLVKGLPLDLHPRAFSPGNAAVTILAHMGVHLWQLDPVPVYELAVFRSNASTFWSWLLDSGAEFGVEVR